MKARDESQVANSGAKFKHCLIDGSRWRWAGGQSKVFKLILRDVSLSVPFVMQYRDKSESKPFHFDNLASLAEDGFIQLISIPVIRGKRIGRCQHWVQFNWAKPGHVCSRKASIVRNGVPLCLSHDPMKAPRKKKSVGEEGA